MEDTAVYVRAEAPGVYSREMVEMIFFHPYCRIKNVVEAGSRSVRPRQCTSRACAAWAF